MATMAFGIAWKQDDANAMGQSLVLSEDDIKSHKNVAVQSKDKGHETHLVPAYIKRFGFCINPYFAKGSVTKADMPIVPTRAKLRNAGSPQCRTALRELKDTGKPSSGWGSWR
eukprot:GHVU01144716.1.p2 GENE.GHVU01144716.1~~GHVU01144716.1.p2  ORF type:complete len:113 (-),score=8.99 GHVU01144716.1:456-794(-)